MQWLAAFILSKWPSDMDSNLFIKSINLPQCVYAQFFIVLRGYVGCQVWLFISFCNQHALWLACTHKKWLLALYFNGNFVKARHQYWEWDVVVNLMTASCREFCDLFFCIRSCAIRRNLHGFMTTNDLDSARIVMRFLSQVQTILFCSSTGTSCHSNVVTSIRSPACSILTGAQCADNILHFVENVPPICLYTSF